MLSTASTAERRSGTCAPTRTTQRRNQRGDGVHLDDGWIYAHRPLIPKGAKQSDWDAGFILPAAQIVSDGRQHHVYFEARSGRVHHENRFNGTAIIGRSSWAIDRIVGVRQAHARSPAGRLGVFGGGFAHAGWPAPGTTMAFPPSTTCKLWLPGEPMPDDLVDEMAGRIHG